MVTTQSNTPAACSSALQACLDCSRCAALIKIVSKVAPCILLNASLPHMLPNLAVQLPAKCTANCSR